MNHIRPAFHEVDAFLWFDQHGLSPYWTVGFLCIQQFDGYGETTVELADGVWHIKLAYNANTGIAPRATDDVGGDRLYEYDIHCDGPGRKKAHFNISPRFDDMRKPDGDPLSVPWCGGEGVDVHTQGSNLSYEDYVRLLQRALTALADEADTNVNQRYFSEPRADSNIVTTELYVRLKRDEQQKLVRQSGVFMKLMHLLAPQKGAQWSYSGDNEQIVGKRHAFDVELTTAPLLVDDHERGKRLKTYHPKYVRSEETASDPLSSPKFGVAFHKSLDDGAVSWGDRDALLRELEETVVNVLDWASVPTQPTEMVYVADDHFAVCTSDRKIGRFADPTPDLEAEQEHVVAWALNELTPSGRAVLETLATDGGQRYDELADETGYSISQIYRVLEEVGSAVVNDNGAVRLFSEKVRQEIQALVESVEQSVESGVARVASLAALDRRSAADSAFQKWCARYGVRVQRLSDGDGKLRLDTVVSMLKYSGMSYPYLPEILREGLEAWTNAGRDASQFLDLRLQAERAYADDTLHGLVKRTIA